MVKETLFLVLNIILVIILYIGYFEKKKVSKQFTKLLIQYKIPEIDLNIDKKDRVNSVKIINRKYKVGLKNSVKIFESLQVEE